MRLCENDNPNVYEVHNRSLGTALIEAATVVCALEAQNAGTYVQVVTSYGEWDGTDQYSVTLYVH